VIIPSGAKREWGWWMGYHIDSSVLFKSTHAVFYSLYIEITSKEFQTSQITNIITGS